LLHQCVQELEHGPHVVADLSFWNLSLVANWWRLDTVDDADECVTDNRS
jgi:hypothetical protein